MRTPPWLTCLLVCSHLACCWRASPGTIEVPISNLHYSDASGAPEQVQLSHHRVQLTRNSSGSWDVLSLLFDAIIWVQEDRVPPQPLPNDKIPKQDAAEPGTACPPLMVEVEAPAARGFLHSVCLHAGCILVLVGGESVKFKFVAR